MSNNITGSQSTTAIVDSPSHANSQEKETPAFYSDTTAELDNQEESIHRHSFLELLFRQKSTTPDDTTKTGHQALLSPSEYNKYVEILRYWDQINGHVDLKSGNHVSQKEFRRSVSRSWYENVKVFRIHINDNADGSIRESLERYDKNSGLWKRVVHVDNVFDAIQECHGTEEHRSIVGTKTQVEKRFWNITEKLCRYFIQTCPRCTQKRSKNKTPTTTNIQSTPDQFLNRYAVSLIDYQSNPQKDIYDCSMAYVLLIHDNDMNWTMLRPITKPQLDIIEQEVLTVLCIQGQHRSTPHKHLLSSALSLANVALMRHDALADIGSAEKAANEIGQEEIHTQLLVAQARKYITMHANRKRENDNKKPNWLEALNRTMMTMNRSGQHQGSPLSHPNNSSMTISTPNFESNLPLGLIENTTRPSNPTTLAGVQNCTSKIPQDNDIKILSQQSTLSTGVRVLDDDVYNNKIHGRNLSTANVSMGDTVRFNTQSSIQASSNPLDKEHTMDDPGWTITTGTALSNADKTDPSTQNTLSQIDNLMEDDDLAAEVKRMYTNDSLNIRSFFTIDRIDEAEDPDEIEEVSPPETPDGNKEAELLLTMYSRYTIKQAFLLGKTTTIKINDTLYRLCHPRLVCEKCDKHASSRSITVAEDNYYEANLITEQWFFPDIVTTFGILCSHDAHRDNMIYDDATLPSISNDPSKKKIVPLPKKIHTIVSIVFYQRHFAVMRLCLEKKRAYFYDGMAMPLDNWTPHMKYILNRHGIDEEKWKIEPGTGNDGMDGILIKQKDLSNCGPIACMVIWKLFKQDEINLQELESSRYREIAVSELRRLLEKHDENLVVYARKERDKKRNKSKASEKPAEFKQAAPACHQIFDTKGSKVNNLVVEESARRSTKPSHSQGVKWDKSSHSQKTSQDDSPVNKSIPTKPARTSGRKRKNRKKIIDDSAETDDDNGLFDDEETPQEKEHIRNYRSRNSKSKKNSTPRETSQQDDDRQIEFEEQSLDRPTATTDISRGQMTEAIAAAPARNTKAMKLQDVSTESHHSSFSWNDEDSADNTQPSNPKNASQVEGSGTILDGLTDSDGEDDRYIESVSIHKATRAPTRKILAKSKKPRSTKSLSNTRNKRPTKCNCQKDCNNRCGCQRNDQPCNSTCTCKGRCSNR